MFKKDLDKIISSQLFYNENRLKSIFLEIENTLQQLMDKRQTHVTVRLHL